jgi:hypothetical protein
MPFVCVCSNMRCMDSVSLQCDILSLKMFVHKSLEIQVLSSAFGFNYLQNFPSYFSDYR